MLDLMNLETSIMKDQKVSKTPSEVDLEFLICLKMEFQTLLPIIDLKRWKQEAVYKIPLDF